MINRSVSEISHMCKALQLDGDGGAVIRGVSTDSRSVSPGNLFIPLVGDHYDGHQFAVQAMEQGAAALMWQADRQDRPAGVPIIIVEDTLEALQSLAAEYRRQLPVRVIGVTGSNGKTTTKDMIAAILSTTYRTHKTEGNLNNHIGLPLTLLQLDNKAEMAVVELGMSGRGEIQLLSRIAGPEAAVITNIGEAHLLQLGSRLEIARAKLEILDGLRPNGLLVYNGDEPLIEEVMREMPLPEGMLRFRFGRNPDNDFYPASIMLSNSGTIFKVNGESGPLYTVPLLGEHNVNNALAAISITKYMGVLERDIVRGLENMKPSAMRAEPIRSKHGLTIINDAFNASPTSVRAAVELLYQLQGYRQKIAVLGDMLELGAEEEALHRKVGSELDPNRIDAVYTFGRLGEQIAAGAASRFRPGFVRSFHSKQELIHALAAIAGPEDVVLVKASRGMKLEEVVHALQTM